jgi:hypothetical protein
MSFGGFLAGFGGIICEFLRVFVGFGGFLAGFGGAFL